MGAALTLSILLPCDAADGQTSACLQQFDTWLPRPEIICIVPDTQREVARQLGAHPSEPYVITAPAGRPAQLRAGLAEAQGNVVLLMDPAWRLAPESQQAIFRTLARSDQGGGFFPLAFQQPGHTTPLADPVAITFAGWLHAPILPGPFFARRLALQGAGGIPTGEPLLDYRLGRALHTSLKVLALPQQATSLTDPGQDAWQAMWQVIRFHCGAQVETLEAPQPTPIEPPLAAPVRKSIEPPPLESTSMLASIMRHVPESAPETEASQPPVEASAEAPPTPSVVVPTEAAEPVALPLSGFAPTAFVAEVRTEVDTRPLAPPAVIDDGPATPAIVQELPAPTPIISADKAGIAAFFAEEPVTSEAVEQPTTLLGKVNAALHRLLFHEPVSPLTPVPGTLPNVSIPRTTPSTDGPPDDDDGRYPTSFTTNSSAEEIALHWTPEQTVDQLHGDPRVPWSRAPLDPADADPFTAAELTQVRRALTDLRHPPHSEQPVRPPGRIIEIAITPPDFAERREKQEGE